jgi:hypothetical protein
VVVRYVGEGDGRIRESAMSGDDQGRRAAYARVRSRVGPFLVYVRGASRSFPLLLIPSLDLLPWLTPELVLKCHPDYAIYSEVPTKRVSPLWSVFIH